MTPERTLPGDWHPGTVPESVRLDETAYVETTFSFVLHRSTRTPSVTFGRGASSYRGTMFDLGPRGRVRLGEYALVHGARIVCDDEVVIGDHALISWNVVIMDTVRFSRDRQARRRELRRVPAEGPRVLSGAAVPQPVVLAPGVWIGFDAVVLPGVHVGEGSVVGARAVVTRDVPAYTVVAGNPARPVRALSPGDREEDLRAATS